jgi:hypothetical protein
MLSSDTSSLVPEPRRLPCITQETPEQTKARALDAQETRVAVHRSDQMYYVRQQKTLLQKNKLKSSATIRCIVTTKLKDTWNKAWHKSPRMQKSKLIDSTIPSQKFLKLINDPDISRKGASWLFQLHTGHIPLNAYLHRFKRTESAKCPACGYHNETPQHFLLNCPAYAHER